MSKVIFGRNSVLAYIEYGATLVEEVLIAETVDDAVVQSLEQRAMSQRIACRRVSKQELGKFVRTSDVHQGVIARVKPFVYGDLDEIIALKQQQGKMALFILLDQLQDPRNLGAVLRTADCTGVDGVIITKHDSSDVTAAAIKASTGAAVSMPVIQVTNTVKTLRKLKAKGIWICTLNMDGASDYRSQRYDMPLCLVVGGEGKGVREVIKRETDFNVFIPMKSAVVNSLNVSVAAALLMYEIAYSRDTFQK